MTVHPAISVRKFGGKQIDRLRVSILVECAGMRPFPFITVVTVCQAVPASAFQQPTNPWATIPRPPHSVSTPYDSQAERQLLDLANQATAEAGRAPLQRTIASSRNSATEQRSRFLHEGILYKGTEIFSRSMCF